MSSLRTLLASIVLVSGCASSAPPDPNAPVSSPASSGPAAPGREPGPDCGFVVKSACYKTAAEACQAAGCAAVL